MNFNPLRREGGDEKDLLTYRYIRDFNPLRREGGDVSDGGPGDLQKISIHSAARAETNPLEDEVDNAKFQSTPPRGRRHLVAGFLDFGTKGFQSTPPRGRRRHHQILVFLPYHISIHSAARAETHEMCESGEIPYISIHSAARAETFYVLLCIIVFHISIHSAARAETVYSCFNGIPQVYFNPLRREGGDSNNTQ